MTVVTIKERASVEIQMPEVTSMALALCGSCSGGLMDVEGLVNRALSELVAIYFTEA